MNSWQRWDSFPHPQTTTVSIVMSNRRRKAIGAPTRKETARRMIQMVQTINQTNFKGVRVVTCYTCHRNLQGAPKITPRLAEQYGEPPDPDPNEVEITRQAPDAPSADQVFDKYLQAVGGAQKVAAVTSIAFKGTY